eukprot:g45964.t1
MSNKEKETLGTGSKTDLLEQCKELTTQQQQKLLKLTKKLGKPASCLFTFLLALCQQRGDRLYVTMRAGHLDIECLLDIGAELTCLPQKYETKLLLDSTVRTAYSAGADRIEIKRTKPMYIAFRPHELLTFVW